MVITWEISRTGFKRFRQTDWWKAVYPAFSQPKEGTGSVCSWLWCWQYSGWCPILYTSSRPVFYPAAGRSAVDRNPGRCFIFLLRAAPCYCTEPDNSANGQGIWNLCFAHTKSKAGVHLWNAPGSGMAWGLFLLFPESDQQPHKQPAKETPGCPRLAGLCKKRLWCRLQIWNIERVRYFCRTLKFSLFLLCG